MKTAIKTLAMLLLAVAPMLGRAQDNQFFREIRDIVTQEDENGNTGLSLFSMPEEGQDHYYLSVGNLGIGDEIIQINFDPVFNLFIPLGDTLDEAQQKLEELNMLAKQPKGTVLETEGCLAFPYPNDDLETVTVTSRRTFFIFKKLEFSVIHGGLLRSTYISRSEISSMITSLKIYRHLHPSEQ